MNGVWRFLREGLNGFIEDAALTRGAAIAFYVVTAIAPTMFLAIWIAGLGFGHDAARSAVMHHLRRMMSPESANIFRFAIKTAPWEASGWMHSIVGVLTLLLTASGVFGEMEDALNVIWRAPQKGSILLRLLRGRVVSLALVIGLGFLLLTSMLFAAGAAMLGHYIDRHTMFSQFTLALINFTISTLLTAVLFAALYKILPNRDIEWRDVIVGASATAIVFQVGQFALGYYLVGSGVAAPYGVAGGLIVMLLWAYYAAQVFLLGAEFTKVYACQFGSQQQGLCETPVGQQAPAPTLSPPASHSRRVSRAMPDTRQPRARQLQDRLR